MSQPVIGYLGLTHLGLCSAVAAAAKGFATIGWDSDVARAERVGRGEFGVKEPNLDALFTEHRANLMIGSDPALISRCDVVYIAADVPTDDNGRSDLTPIRALFDAAAPRLKHGAALVILCQVPPGYTRKLPLDPDRLYGQVETLVFGMALERALKPERYIIGCADPTRPLPPALATYLGAFGCPIAPMAYESAECAKISINMCLVASVTVANVMAELCEHIGANWADIAPVLKLDRRIGPYSYLSPGLGIAGGNLERDLVTVRRLADEHGCDAKLVDAWRHNSAYRRDWAARIVHAEVLAKHPDAAIALLGVAYKENTASTKNSPSLALLKALPGVRFRAFDPQVQVSVAGHAKAAQATDAMDAIAGADALVIMTPWPEFRKLSPQEIAGALKGRIVIDPYRVLESRACIAAGLRYFTLGEAPARGAA